MLYDAKEQILNTEKWKRKLRPLKWGQKVEWAIFQGHSRKLNSTKLTETEKSKTQECNTSNILTRQKVQHNNENYTQGKDWSEKNHKDNNNID